VEMVNDRFETYLPARFGKYLDTTKFGPGLGSVRDRGEMFRQVGFGAELNKPTATCASCHRTNQLGPLNWPMDSTLISSFVKGGKMPLYAKLRSTERAQLYKQLIDDYFAIDQTRPGILKSWLLGKRR